MKILQDSSKLYQGDDGLPIASIRIDLQLNNSVDPLEDNDWIHKRIKEVIAKWNEINPEKAAEEEEEDQKSVLSHFLECPITKTPIDGTIKGVDAVKAGLITKKERSLMKSTDKGKVLENKRTIIDYNETYCTLPYSGKLQDLKPQHRKVTIIL